MKILLATETLHAGGAETFVVRLANALSDKHEVAIVVYYKHIVNPGVLAQLLPSVKVYYINIAQLSLKQKADSFFRKTGIDFSLAERALASAAKQIIDSFKPDIIHSHLFKTDYIIANLKKAHNYQFIHITTIHGDYSSFYNNEVDARMLHVRGKIKDTLSSLDHIVCLCEEHQDFFLRNFQETTSKLALIYNGYQPANEDYKTQTKATLGLPPDKFLFGMVSRGVEKKGWQKAIDAFIAADINNAALVLVGSGDFLDKLAAENKCPNIIFTGFSSTPITFIQHFDVCLLPTLFHYESLPTAVMEYLFCNKPVIATNVGEIGKMITAAGTMQAGDLLSFNNLDVHVAELSDLMRRYYSEPGYLSEKSAHATKAFSKFDMKKCTESYLALYQQRQVKDAGIAAY